MTEMGRLSKKADENKTIKQHIEKDIEQINEKVEIINKMIPVEKQLLGFMKEEFELKKSVQDLIMEKCNKIKPDFEYEDTDEYKAYVKKNQELSTKRYMFEREVEIETKEKKIENLYLTIDEHNKMLKHKQDLLNDYE